MIKKKRYFVSVYFHDGKTGNRKKRDVTLSFPSPDEFYLKCKYLGSTGIKKAIGLTSYVELAREAAEEERTISNFIKYRLKIEPE